jgi:hypothetical protein
MFSCKSDLIKFGMEMFCDFFYFKALTYNLINNFCPCFLYILNKATFKIHIKNLDHYFFIFLIKSLKNFAYISNVHLFEFKKINY